MREPIDTLRNVPYALGAMVHRKHRRDVREQNLRGANVAVGFLAADMLLASLQRHAESLTAALVDRDADDASWHRALIVILCRKVCRVWSAETHWYAETLGGADHDIGAHFTRWLEQSKAHDVGCGDGNRIVLMQYADETT